MVQPSPKSRLECVLGRALRSLGAILAVALIFVTAPALQAPAATKTEKTFGTWSVVCVEPDKQPKSCSMIQSHVQANAQTQKKRMVLRWAISNSKTEQKQTVIVPAGVSVTEGVRLFLGNSQPIVLAYGFCGPRVCIASAPIDAKTIAGMKGDKKASASYVLPSKKLVQIQLDLNGFAEAYDFLVAQLS